MKDPKLRQFQEISALLNSSLHPTEIRKRAIEAATLLMDRNAGNPRSVFVTHKYVSKWRSATDNFMSETDQIKLVE